ncbi:MAG: hypothetical protein NLN65_04955 [Candidatus Poseidoniaceae archaeon]|nr:hypothetical protein [Candidatus Poseidoniaceae archaeon]
MTKKNNEKMNINEIMAIFVAYIQQQMEYTGMKIKAMKEWEIDDSKEVLISEDSEPSFGETFSKEWL